MKILKRSVLVLVFLNLIACSNWQLVQRSDFQEIRKEKPFIRVALTDGSLYETKNYSINTDSLVIFTSEKSSYTGKTSAIPLDKVETIKKKKVDQAKSVLLTTISAIGFFALIGAR